MVRQFKRGFRDDSDAEAGFLTNLVDQLIESAVNDQGLLVQLFELLFYALFKLLKVNF